MHLMMGNVLIDRGLYLNVLNSSYKYPSSIHHYLEIENIHTHKNRQFDFFIKHNSRSMSVDCENDNDADNDSNTFSQSATSLPLRTGRKHGSLINK
jgi:hypothetical protein